MESRADRYYVFNLRYGRMRVPAPHNQTQEAAIAWAKQVESMNLVRERGVLKNPTPELVWKAGQ